MTEPMKSRNFLKLALVLFAVLVLVAMGIAAYRYATPQPEADIEAAR